MTLRTLAGLTVGAWCLLACARAESPVPLVASVDVPRFMGSWYVIACIPTRLERNAFDAVETYALRPDGRIQTTFRYRDGADGPARTLHPIATVRPGSGNALWGMQFIWPIKAEYRIAYLSGDYGLTIIGRSQRDYAWIMARTPQIDLMDYGAALRRLRDWGYDVSRLRRVPQRSR
jgi:apolipoprotein D and lipocalin family protein